MYSRRSLVLSTLLFASALGCSSRPEPVGGTDAGVTVIDAGGTLDAHPAPSEDASGPDAPSEMDARADGGETDAPMSAIDAGALSDAGTDAGLDVDAGPPSPGGIGLSWSDCGASGTTSATWSCDSNTGPPVASFVASFVPPPGITELVGVSAQLEIRSEGASLPDWWMHGDAISGATGRCRANMGLALSFDFTGFDPPSCADWTAGHAVSAFVYEILAPDRARIRVQAAIPFESRTSVSPSDEHYAFRFSLLRSRTVGVDSCAGCSEPMTITLESIQLYQPPELLRDPVLVTPIGSTVIQWQPVETP